MGEPVSEWITYDGEGKKHKITNQARREQVSFSYTVNRKLIEWLEFVKELKRRKVQSY
jgi:predicted HTH domain antitoxin